MSKLWGTMSRLVMAVAAVACLVVPATAQSSKRPTVALLDLDFGTVQQWWSGNWDIGKGIADLIVDGLVEDGSYRVIERKRLDAILAEQNFSNSDRADPTAAKVAKLGKALGVKFLIVGSITKFGTENKDMKVGGGGFGSKFGVGQVGTKKGKATVAIATRVVDTSTGEVMVVAKGEGTSSRSGLLLAGGAGGGGGAGVGGVEMGSSDFRESVLGEATEAAVKQVVANLVAKKERVTNPE
jgi:curli biogenesis system outer membrane secretion channel CsgG